MYLKCRLGWLPIFFLCLVTDAVAEPIRVGYWTGGAMQAFGAIMESGKFLEAEGLTPEFIHFADINGPTRAIATHSVDVAFAPIAGSFGLAVQGAPIRIVLATQVAEGDFVVAMDSPIHSLADLRGKRLGTSPAGSSIRALAVAVLARNYGFDEDSLTIIPGADPKLAQLLTQKDIDVGVLRRIIVDGLPDAHLRRIGTLDEEWRRMTHGDAPPLIAVAVARSEYAQDQPAAILKYIKGIVATTQWGASHPDRVEQLLQGSAALDKATAVSAATQWPHIFIARLTPGDVATLRTTAEIFRSQGLIDMTPPEDLIQTVPFETAMSGQ